MVKGLYTAHTGMVNEMKRLDIMASMVNFTSSEVRGSPSWNVSPSRRVNS